MKGIPSSPGMALAKALWLMDADRTLPHVQTSDRDAEWRRLEVATQAVQHLLEQMMDSPQSSLTSDERQILETHLMLLTDPELLFQLETDVTSKQDNVEQSVERVFDMYAAMLEELDDEYLAARATDVREVKWRLLQQLLGRQSVDWTAVQEPVIIVADDLGPSQTLQLPRKWVKGMVLRNGSRLSHSSIVARTLGIPAIVGCGEAIHQIAEGTLIGIDGHAGEVWMDLRGEQLAAFETRVREEIERQGRLQRWIGQPARTIDGVHVEVFANIGSTGDAEEAVRMGADGIGLFRTEFLLMDRTDFPSEDNQFEVYRKVLEMLDGKPVVVRTFDIGGDKPLSYFPIQEANPFLGYRGIRIGIAEPDILRTQLRALYRASGFGNLRIMFPMISTVEEWRSAKQLAESARQSVGARTVPLGMMVETPAAVLMADIFAAHVDFFSIGTNDLTQYVMTADRGNAKVADLANPFQPAVLRAIQHVMAAGRQHGISVGMCGELAGELAATSMLLGLGLREFSMASMQVVEAKERLSSLTVSKCEGLMVGLNACHTVSAVQALMQGGDVGD